MGKEWRVVSLVTQVLFLETYGCCMLENLFDRQPASPVRFRTSKPQNSCFRLNIGSRFMNGCNVPIVNLLGGIFIGPVLDFGNQIFEPFATLLVIHYNSY